MYVILWERGQRLSVRIVKPGLIVYSVCTSGFWPRVRARALREPVFFGFIAVPNGALRAPPPIAAALLLIRPPKIFTIYRTWAAYVKGFFLSTKAMKN
jgi:hypothetical protein